MCACTVRIQCLHTDRKNGLRHTKSHTNRHTKCPQRAPCREICKMNQTPFFEKMCIYQRGLSLRSSLHLFLRPRRPSLFFSREIFFNKSQSESILEGNIDSFVWRLFKEKKDDECVCVNSKATSANCCRIYLQPITLTSPWILNSTSITFLCLGCQSPPIFPHFDLSIINTAIDC